MKYDYAKQIFSQKSSQSADRVEPERVDLIEYIGGLRLERGSFKNEVFSIKSLQDTVLLFF